jgi:hypothetical protein
LFSGGRLRFLKQINELFLRQFRENRIGRSNVNSPTRGSVDNSLNGADER